MNYVLYKLLIIVSHNTQDFLCSIVIDHTRVRSSTYSFTVGAFDLYDFYDTIHPYIMFRHTFIPMCLHMQLDFTPLHCASMNGHTRVVKLLIEHGAQNNIPSTVSLKLPNLGSLWYDTLGQT